MWHNVLFVFLAGGPTLLALIGCMFIVTSRIFNLIVLEMYLSRLLFYRPYTVYVPI